ncbi:hypothetical protein [Mastigocladopsis repens]|uniref:hypothetical protein n=1 Tax=Mastigocladopsis repens TaxID=221287 RepID=UPI0002FE0D6E|nr:hypothetical protein [Mastigocladopsis repens]
MKLDSSRPNCATLAILQTLDWSSKSDIKESAQDFQPNSWVKLLELPNPYSFDEALLLCQVSRDEWLAWIPDHGEAQLHVSQMRW